MNDSEILGSDKCSICGSIGEYPGECEYCGKIQKYPEMAKKVVMEIEKRNYYADVALKQITPLIVKDRVTIKIDFSKPENSTLFIEGTTQPIPFHNELVEHVVQMFLRKL